MKCNQLRISVKNKKNKRFAIIENSKEEEEQEQLIRFINLEVFAHNLYGVTFDERGKTKKKNQRNHEIHHIYDLLNGEVDLLHSSSVFV